jgi:hypothetical protein
MKKITILAFSFALLLTACATNKVDWQSRVGNYSYDQAVLEFGPPDKEATLQNGTRVSEWLTSRGRSNGGFATYMGRGLGCNRKWWASGERFVALFELVWLSGKSS